MDELVYITGKYRTSYQHFNEDDTVTEFMDGYMVDVFIPATRVDDVDRNDTFADRDWETSSSIIEKPPQ